MSKETARKVMIRAGVWQAKKQRRKHRKRRERKPMLGIMVQLDGSPHDWFEGRAGKCTLLVFIDDATSQILQLEFVQSESVMALQRATKKYVKKHGIPGSFYTDHGSLNPFKFSCHATTYPRPGKKGGRPYPPPTDLP